MLCIHVASEGGTGPVSLVIQIHVGSDGDRPAHSIIELQLDSTQWLYSLMIFV